MPDISAASLRQGHRTSPVTNLHLLFGNHAAVIASAPHARCKERNAEQARLNGEIVGHYQKEGAQS
ncbi:hypothetical protein [Brevibacillus sp. SAFN-007a]|uniref:hypothetical protein n=1 Tax=Brevibacillus sp. SAFN-007a TaxID=3436862 RepID=UPI003F7EA37F